MKKIYLFLLSCFFCNSFCNGQLTQFVRAQAYFIKKIVDNRVLQKELKKRIQYEQLPFSFKNDGFLKTIRWEHIFLGTLRVRAQKLKGLHSSHYSSDLLVRVIEGPNSHGIFCAEWKVNGFTPKRSTFFPAEWDEYIMADKLLESLENTADIEVKNGVLHISGHTAEGINLHSFMTRRGVIQTVFPVCS